MSFLCAGAIDHTDLLTEAEHALPELHFDYVFLGTRDESETQAIQVIPDTKIGMMFAHHVRKKGNVECARRAGKSSGTKRLF